MAVDTPMPTTKCAFHYNFVFLHYYYYSYYFFCVLYLENVYIYNRNLQDRINDKTLVDCF